jgi:hypothetical protein
MRQDVYGVAYEEARAELLEIVRRFEELRRRKESLESVVIALGPVLGVEGRGRTPVEPISGQMVKGAPKAAPELPVGQQANPSLSPVAVPTPAAEEPITEPFQRRVRDALKFSASNNGHDQKGLQPAI